MEAAPEERYRPSRVLAFGLPAVALTAIVVAVVWSETNRRRSDRARIAAAEADIEKQLAAIRARGEPTTYAEFNPPPIPDDGNAAVIYEQAFTAFESALQLGRRIPNADDWMEVLWGDGPFEDRRALVESAMARYAEAMRLAREAMKRPQCRFDLKYSDGPSMVMPHLAGMRSLARLFAAEALLHAHSGRAGRAADSFVCGIRLARAFDGEPVYISQVLKSSLLGIALKALERAEKDVPLDDAARRRILADLAMIKPLSSVRCTFMGERVTWHESMRLLLADSPLPDNEDARSARRRFTRDRAAAYEDHARLLRLTSALFDATERPPWQMLEVTASALAKVESLDSHDAPLTSQIAASYEYMVKRTVKAEAHRIAAILGLSCELFRSGVGRFPATLTELAPEFLDKLPPDPFTGKPFRYRLRDGGRAFIVYSVGDNLKDDGGVTKRPEKDDISWEGKAREGR